MRTTNGLSKAWAATAVLLGASVFPPSAAAAPVVESPAKAVQEATGPDEALARLLEGNRRFVDGKPRRRDLAGEVKTSAPAQYPFAVVLGCIDSRVAPETVFDQGIGDIFSTRIAGNVVDDDVLGSLEYATRAAGARLILVLGHTHCGAVQAACRGVSLAHVDGILEKIKPSIAAESAQSGAPDPKSQGFVDRVAARNVERSVDEILQRSAVIAELARSGRIAVRGALYDVETGTVRVVR